MSNGHPGLTGITLSLLRARLTAGEGERLLFVASALAYVVSSALAFTVAGGTWMFHRRADEPFGVMAEMVASEGGDNSVLAMYVGLAALACFLTVPAITSLAASAAVLGAHGRERRMAVLRLLGVSSRQVTRMALIETVAQAVVGSLLGFLLYLLALPLWGRLTMQMEPIGLREMLLPWWLLLGVSVLVVVIGTIASWWGLQQVRVSPLGVARRSSSPALRWWRLPAFFILVGIVWAGMATVRPNPTVLPWIITGGLLLALMIGANLVGPWVLQTLCRVLALLPLPSAMWAARRVQADPRGTWNRVAGVGLIAFVGAYVSSMPLPSEAPDTTDPAEMFMVNMGWDITKGAIITLSVGFVLAATATFINQTSAVYERADQARALERMGASVAVIRRVTWLEALGPLLLALTLGAGLGIAFAQGLAAAAESRGLEHSATGPVILAVTLGGGVLLTALAVAATGPLQRRTLLTQERTAD
ncbi:FtsX-like permease family protein [Kytococcus sp. Marseille-QA3725]